MPTKLRFHVASATFVSLAVILVVAVAGAIASSGGQALASHVNCGDTITADTTLHHDLVNCPNNGIIIGADDITLDLNGHTIDGDGTEAAGCNRRKEFCDEGLPNFGHDGVTVMHGSVRDFAVGPEVAKARHVRLLDISSTSHVFFGAVFFKSARSVIRNGSFSRNIPPEGDGIGVFSSDHIRILQNKVRHNPGPGIHVEEDSNEILIKRNVFSRNSPGILMDGDRNEARRNRCTRNDACVLVDGSRNVIARNRIHKGGDGIAIENGHGTLVARNEIVGPHKAGVYLAINSPPIGGRDNLIRRNFVRASGDDAFLVRREDRHSQLKRNVAVGAGDDGFDIQSRTAKLTRNRAVRNHDLGIEAVRGVIDGGGNIARHNGDPRQCTHIVCN